MGAHVGTCSISILALACQYQPRGATNAFECQAERSRAASDFAELAGIAHAPKTVIESPVASFQLPLCYQRARSYQRLTGVETNSGVLPYIVSESEFRPELT